MSKAKERNIEMKKILLVNGSPNLNGNTATALKIAEKIFIENNIKVEWFQIGTKPVRGCVGCDTCEKTHRCVFKDDACNELIEAILDADALLVGTPVYFAGPNGALCALFDRAFYATANFGQLLKGKPVASITTCWRAGSTTAIDRLNRYYSLGQMPIITSEYWNGYFGENDDFGKNAIKTLAENMVDVISKTQMSTDSNVTD